MYKGKNMIIKYQQERITHEELIDFLKRSDLGCQYPKERFKSRIKSLVKNVQISLTARDENNNIIGICFGITDFSYWLFITDLGVDRKYTKMGIGTHLVKTAHEIAGGEKNIGLYLVASDNAIPFYEKIGMEKSEDVMQLNNIDWTEFEVK